jgi:cytochrome b involved in lipid metabolism
MVNKEKITKEKINKEKTAVRLYVYVLFGLILTTLSLPACSNVSSSDSIEDAGTFGNPDTDSINSNLDSGIIIDEKIIEQNFTVIESDDSDILLIDSVNETDQLSSINNVSIDNAIDGSIDNGPIDYMNRISDFSSSNNCLSILDGKVYNLTLFVKIHPGGSSPILNACGKDGTSILLKKHSLGIVGKLAKYLVN